jgi:hypothetical protein
LLNNKYWILFLIIKLSMNVIEKIRVVIA